MVALFIMICSSVILFTCVSTIYICRRYYFDLKEPKKHRKKTGNKIVKNAYPKRKQVIHGSDFERYFRDVKHANLMLDLEDNKKQRDIAEMKRNAVLYDLLVTSELNGAANVGFTQVKSKAATEVLMSDKMCASTSSLIKVNDKDYVNNKNFNKIEIINTKDM